MLFLLFQLGKERYALQASRVVEVVPLLELKQLPQAPKGVAGIFNYHGRPVPAVDLCALTLGQPASERFSTRIIIVNYPDDRGISHLLGLIAEHATEMLRKEPNEFMDSGVKLSGAPYLGPILMDSQHPVQWIYEQRLLPERVRDLLFSEPAALCHETV
ncbi:MAG TPA: chemotaxis protein CheW [Verrucomicrobiae bacterium]